MKHYLTEKDFSVVCTLSELEDSNAIRKKSSMMCRFGPFNSSIHQILHCPSFTTDWKALALFQKNPLNARHKYLRLQFAKEILEGSACFWRSIYFSDESPFKHTTIKESQRVICGPRFTKSYTNGHLQFKHPTQLFSGRAFWRLVTNRWFNGWYYFC